MSKKKRREIEDLAHEMADAMYKAVDYLDEHSSRPSKVAKEIGKAVKKYFSSHFSTDDDITLYNELMDALEETGAANEVYPQKEPGVDY